MSTVTTAVPVVEGTRFSIMVSAGEASGDQHAANALRALRDQGVDFDAFGMGAGELEKVGATIHVDCRELAVIGLVEVLKNLPELYRRLFQLVRLIKRKKPHLVMLVDYPEFNLKLAWWVRKLNIPILFYISPQVWAWRSHRVHKIGQRIDHMAVIFPFEVPFYEQANIPVTYVGHPLIDSAKCDWTQQQARQELALSDINTPIVALIPGSRNSELQRNLPVMLQSAHLILATQPNVQFVLPCAPSLDRAEIEAVIEQNAVADSPLPLSLVNGQICPVLRTADASITASGTATLETALMGTPMAVVYRVNELTFAIMSRLIQIDNISLVNIVAGRRIVQEFIQREATADKIAAETLRLLNDDPYRVQMRDDLAEVKQKMGDGGASHQVARLLRELASGR